jgi:hypothetical protein
MSEEKSGRLAAITFGAALVVLLSLVNALPPFLTFH